MLRQRSVAGLAVYMRVLAYLLCICLIGMAGLARLMSGKMNGLGSDFADGIAAVVSVLPKALRNYVPAYEQKDEKGYHE